MSGKNSDKEKFVPSQSLDAELQRQLDAALGEDSLEDLMATDQPPVAGGEEPGGEPDEWEGVQTGTVLAVQGDDIFISLGGRNEGVLPATQFDDEELPVAGDSVEVTVQGYDEGEGLLSLSRKGAALPASWDNLEEGQIVEGMVTGTNAGGLELSINGIRAFMPVSQIEMFHVDEPADYVDQRLRCQAVEVDRRGKNLIVSRRALLEIEAAEAREKLWETLEEEQIIEGVVRNIMPYGAFVDIGGADGLLHISDMAHSRVEDPHDILSEGERVKVMVLKVDREERKISLGLKQVMPDPWTGAEHKWPPDTLVTGRVTKLADFGAFVELEEGVEGLIPISEMSYQRRINHPSEVVQAGDTVKVRVLNVDPEKRRISLSIKQTGNDPWIGASVRWPADSVVEGIVTRLADFGAFVELTPGVEGLVHISELSDEHVRSVGDVVREGEQVRAKVLSVDEEKRRISLSLKQAAAGDAGEIPSAEEINQQQDTPRHKRPLKGGLD